MQLGFDLAEILRAQTSTLTLLRVALGLAASLPSNERTTAPREQPAVSRGDRKGSKTDAPSE